MAFGAAAIRLRQGTRALSAFARPVDWAQAAAVLTPEELALFRRMQRSEQLHSLHVLVSAHADDSPVLAQAALLHDVGKTRYPLRLWQRTLPVLAGVVSPGLARRLSDRDPRPVWSRGFVVAAHHPAWSADLAAACSAPDAVVWLIRHHADDAAQWADHPLHPLLVRLQVADGEN